MEETLACPQRAIGVRGNCFSFLLPWEDVMGRLSKAFGEGDFSAWPLDQDTAAQVVRVRFVRGHEALRQQFKELKVRSRVVKAMANLYVDNHLEELLQKSSVVKLLTPRGPDLREDLRKHIATRVEEDCPESQHGGDEGCVPEKILQAVNESEEVSGDRARIE